MVRLLTCEKNKRTPVSAVNPNVSHFTTQCSSYYSIIQNYKYFRISNKRQLTVW